MEKRVTEHKKVTFQLFVTFGFVFFFFLKTKFTTTVYCIRLHNYIQFVEFVFLPHMTMQLTSHTITIITLFIFNNCGRKIGLTNVCLCFSQSERLFSCSCCLKLFLYFLKPKFTLCTYVLLRCKKL